MAARMTSGVRRGPANRAAEGHEVALVACLFHLNLSFSSLEEEDQPAVIERCYRPLLALAEENAFPVGIEASGWTLERIAELAPDWLASARELIDAGRMELVGSGYAQLAGPLVPAEVNRWNLRLGLESYERLLAARPRLALIGEQAYSPGILDLYAEAGYAGVIADWDNAWRSHPEWGRETRHRPQLARGLECEVPVVWSESVAFQKFQRYAHAEMTRDEYVEFVRGAVRDGGALMLYANDAEVFDHRPGRFAAEPEMQEPEWERIGEGLRALTTAGVVRPVLPSRVLTLLETSGAGRVISLEAPDQPIPVKKQDKYNISRWAVTGRDDVDLNTRCGRLHQRLRAVDPGPEAWRELCALWASDLRTHITERRWASAMARLQAAEAAWGVTPAAAPRAAARSAATGSGTAALPDGVTRQGRFLRVIAGDLEVVLSTRRGLAVVSYCDRTVGDESLFGAVEHGYFETIDISADWYTGNLVQETPLRHKVTDLERVEPRIERAGSTIVLSGSIESELGWIEKAVTIDPEAREVVVDWTLRWAELPPGSLRLGHVTLHPEALDRSSLFYATHNGGSSLEYHELGDEPVDHGLPVSALVSTRMGLGVTEGLLRLGDRHKHVRVRIDHAVARPLGLITYRPAPRRFFLQASFSLTESDDTRRGAIPRSPERPQRARIAFAAARERSG
jgi:hypothetical protein